VTAGAWHSKQQRQIISGRFLVEITEGEGCCAGGEKRVERSGGVWGRLQELDSELWARGAAGRSGTVEIR